MRRGNYLALLTTVLCSACATSTAPNAAQSTESNGTGSAAEPGGVQAPVEAGANRVPLGQLVRELGQQYRRNIVLMNGIEYYFAGPYTPEVAGRDSIARKIAEDTGMTLTRLPAYEFIHPPGFETLTEFSPSKQLSRRMANITTTIRVGADTPLYAAFALLGHSHGVTLIADNVIASALCGETTLHNVTLGEAVDAILRAARLTDATCAVDVDGDAALFYSPRAEWRARLLVNASTVTRPAALDRHVSLYLPHPPADAQRLLEESRAVPLENCAQSIGEQIGMRVEFDRNCRRLPVNPCVMSDVTIETAMRLLIRQWPLPLYGYTATEDTLRIVYLGPPTA